MDDILCELHFYECYDESLYLTESEINDWFDYIEKIINDESKSKWYRLQKIIESLTKE